MKQFIFTIALLLTLGATAQQWDIQLPDYQVEEIPTLYGGQIVDYGHSYLRAGDWYDVTQGERAIVFVGDTGCDLDHPDLRDNIDLEISRDYTASKSGLEDMHGHGTHVAGLVAALNNDLGVLGIAPKATLAIQKILNDNGSGSYTWLENMLYWVADLNLPERHKGKRKIVTLSLGGPNGTDALHKAIKYAVSKGVFVVVAAGNSGCATSETINSPGNYPEVITVASIGKAEIPSYFSSCGKNIDVAAPGESVYSTHRNGGYARLSGTSMATPLVAGVVALLSSKYPQLTAQAALEAYLRKHAKDIHDAGWDNQTGYGAPIVTNYSLPPDGAAPPDDPKPDDPNSPPTFRSERTLTVPVNGTYTMMWKAQDAGKYTYTNLNFTVAYKTKYRAPDAVQEVTNQMRKFWTRRGFVLLKGDDEMEALYWGRYFCEMISKDQGFDIRITEITGTDEHGQRYQLLDNERRAPLNVRWFSRANRINSFTFNN